MKYFTDLGVIPSYPAPHRRAGDVEGVVVAKVRGVVAPLHNEGVGGASLQLQLRDQAPVHIPSYAPTGLTWNSITLNHVPSRYNHKSEHNGEWRMGVGGVWMKF